MVSLIKLSIENKMRPTAVIYREPDPYSDWSDLDYKLVQAYHTLKEEICPKCGNPLWLCRSTDSNIDWSIDSTTCYASRAIEERRFRDDNGATKQPTAQDRAKWGTDYFARAVPIRKDIPLPTRSTMTDT